MKIMFDKGLLELCSLEDCGGPSAGGAMILHNDNVSLNSAKTNVNSSGYGGSSNLINSMNSSVASSVVNGTQPIKSSSNPLSDNKFTANNSSFSDVENGRIIFLKFHLKILLFNNRMKGRSRN